MMIVDQGAIVEVCAEAGEFVYDTSPQSRVFSTETLEKSIGDSFIAVWKAFHHGRRTRRGTRESHFFNTKEIVGNKYGTANAVPFRVVDQNIGLDVDIAIRCHGEYSYRMVDPILFYKNICGNIEEDYTRDKIDSQLRSELLDSSAAGLRENLRDGSPATVRFRVIRWSLRTRSARSSPTAGTMYTELL
ncbi:MAG: SPFH domain-containing protein [Pilosibacter sp.]